MVATILLTYTAAPAKSCGADRPLFSHDRRGIIYVMMHHRMPSLIALLGLLFVCRPADAQAEYLVWKAVVVAGSAEQHVFDNGRRAIVEQLLERGLRREDIRELSVAEAAPKQGVQRSTLREFEAALRSLAIGQGDGCLLYMTSHGLPEGFVLEGRRRPAILSPAELDRLLDRHCADNPTVVIVSACYSGVFLDHGMSQDNRVILTAASRDRTSFGCSNDYRYTFYDRCFLENFRQVRAWNDLHQALGICIEALESGKGFRPSLPLAHFGSRVPGPPHY